MYVDCRIMKTNKPLIKKERNFVHPNNYPDQKDLKCVISHKIMLGTTTRQPAVKKAIHGPLQCYSVRKSI